MSGKFVGNGVAHKLARHVLHVGELSVWVEDFSDFIHSQVWLDANYNSV